MASPRAPHNPAKEGKKKKGKKGKKKAAKPKDVRYLKLYLMVVALVKAVLLVVGAFGNHRLVTVAVATAISSCVLSLVTYSWFHTAAGRSQKLAVSEGAAGLPDHQVLLSWRV